MPQCQNCESHVTQDFVRVFTPARFDGPRVCPNCDDKIRAADGTVRDAKAHREGNGEDPVSYDPEMFADGGQA